MYICVMLDCYIYVFMGVTIQLNPESHPLVTSKTFLLFDTVSKLNIVVIYCQCKFFGCIHDENVHRYSGGCQSIWILGQRSST